MTISLTSTVLRYGIAPADKSLSYAIFEDRLHSFDEFFDDRIIIILLEHLDKISEVENRLFWKFIA